jgi:hypothetical protein
MHKTNYKYKPEYCEMLIEHMGQGLSLRSFAGKIRVVRSTVYEWIKTFPEFAEAKEIGEDVRLMYYEQLASAKASGRKIAGFDHKKSDFRAIEFMLKTQYHEEYSDKKDVTHSGEIKINIDKDDAGL